MDFERCAAQVELVVIDWHLELCGLPDRAGGLFTSGGSIANVTGLAAARYTVLDDEVDEAAAYCSDQTHQTVDRALHLLGFGPHHHGPLLWQTYYKRMDIPAFPSVRRPVRAVSGREVPCTDPASTDELRLLE